MFTGHINAQDLLKDIVIWAKWKIMIQRSKRVGLNVTGLIGEASSENRSCDCLGPPLPCSHSSLASNSLIKSCQHVKYAAYPRAFKIFSRSRTWWQFWRKWGPRVSQHDRRGAKEKEEEVLGTCFGSCEWDSEVGHSWEDKQLQDKLRRGEKTNSFNWNVLYPTSKAFWALLSLTAKGRATELFIKAYMQ